MESGAGTAPAKTYEMVGHSQRMRQLIRLATKVGRGNWPVLLLGETGTGKEVMARTIHNCGPEGPFVPIDCSALVGPLMESELFGSVKGAYTGADKNRDGLIKAANGGTAFFDEIGELPLDLQAKLLRVLQEREYRPVGASKAEKSNFRVIAATNRDLAKEVEKGRFRQDLFFRLSVVSIRIAPLRERRDDIPALIEHFLRQYDANYDLSPQLRELMLAYAWPGNVRELENCIQRMVALNTGPVINLADAPSFLINSGAEMAHLGTATSALSEQTLAALARMAPAPAPEVEDEPLKAHATAAAAGAPEFSMRGVVPLVELERNAIIHALKFTRGDRVMAAHLLGIGRTTLYRKLREYNIKD